MDTERRNYAISIKAEPSAGMDIRDGCKQAVELANRLQIPVDVKMNEVLVLAEPGDDPERLYAAFELARMNKRKIAASHMVPEVRLARYDGLWNYVIQGIGCWAIRNKTTWWVAPNGNVHAAPFFSLTASIDSGTLVPNRWPIPPGSEAAKMFADFIADNPAERFRRTDPVKRFAEKVIERLRAESDPANTDREIGLHVAMNIVRQMAEKQWD